MTNKPTAMSKKRKEMLELLQEAQRKTGFLSQEAMAKVAETLNTPKSDVYGVATFYSFLSIKPQGRNIIRICQSLPCHYKNGQTVIDSIARELGIKPGETTADGKYSLTLTNCIGACDKAPAILINDEVHGNLTPAKITQILKTYK